MLWALESVLDAGGDWGRRNPGLGYTQTQERPPTPKGVALCDWLHLPTPISRFGVCSAMQMQFVERRDSVTLSWREWAL